MIEKYLNLERRIKFKGEIGLGKLIFLEYFTKKDLEGMLDKSEYEIIMYDFGVEDIRDIKIEEIGKKKLLHGIEEEIAAGYYRSIMKKKYRCQDKFDMKLSIILDHYDYKRSGNPRLDIKSLGRKLHEEKLRKEHRKKVIMRYVYAGVLASSLIIGYIISNFLDYKKIVPENSRKIIVNPY